MSGIAPLPATRPASQAALAAVELSIVVPTFCEADNVGELVARVAAAMAGRRWEIIFVDDNSSDQTHARAKQLAAQNVRVRCIRRVDRRGLAGACIEGILSSSAPFVAVMDADLQHDERLLSRMLTRLEQGDADLVVGTRYVEGGSADGLADGHRSWLSSAANGAAQHLFGISLSDPMSGFFMLRREIVEDHAGALSADGFKILLDIVTAAGPSLRIAEEPYHFRPRFAGTSKFDTRIAIEFVGLILSKLSFGLITPRFVVFALVGTTGLGVHMLALLALYGSVLHRFGSAQALATLIAMTNNYLLNNLLTYRDRRLSGFGMLKGFFGFCAIGSAGAIANVGVASWLFAQEPVWWLAGLCGAVMGALWNYSMSSRLVWRTR